MKRKLTKSLVTSICSSVCLLGASAGIVFGISAGMYKLQYMGLGKDQIQKRAEAANGANNYYSQKISSKWNMNENLDPKKSEIDQTTWNKLHGEDSGVPMPNLDKNGDTIDWGEGDLSEDNLKARWNYSAMVIDGSTHSTLDRSFNQSLYNGIVNFIQNKDVDTTKLVSESTVMPRTLKDNYTAASFRPAEDNNNGLTSTYKAVAADSNNFRMIGLAGFNHVSPLNDLGSNDKSGRFVYGEQFTNLRKMNMILIDGNVPNNQNIASVLFRSDQPGFLTGVATCMYFFNNLHTYHKNYRDLSIAAYGGNPIPTVIVYMGGVQRGIEFFNEFVLARSMLDVELIDVINDPSLLGTDRMADLKKLIDHSKNKDEIYKFINDRPSSKYTDPNDIKNDLYSEYQIKMVKLGGFATHFTGSFTSGDAIGITKQYLTRGASAIIAVAGPQSLDTAQEIQNQGSDCIVIGVDSAMEDGQYQRKFGKSGFEDVSVDKFGNKPAQKDNIIKFSAVKDMTTVTKKFLELCKDNKYFDIADPNDPTKPDENKAICGAGYQTCGNILNGLISISFDGWHPLVQALRHITNVTQQKSFETLWENAAVAYLATHDEIPSAVKKNLQKIENIDTYNKNLQIGDDASDTVGKYYTHITAILGQMLNSQEIKLNFKNMTVRPVKDASGKITGYEPVTEDITMTILEWLENNMYFTI